MPFHVMAKPGGAVCNLDCGYCFYLEKEKLYPKSPRQPRMSDEVLESYIQQMIEAHPQEASFAWQGGEPTLLGVDFYRKVVELQKKYANGKSVSNAFQTNGVLLDDEWGEFLCSIYDRWVRQDVGQVFVQLFEVAVQSYMGLPQGLCLFRPTCGDAVALEHTGDLYSCDHYVYPENRLGQIMESPLESLVNSPEQRAFGRAKQDTLPAYCRRCEVRGACHGECPKNRFLETPDGEPGLNYLCRGYRRFFNHIQPTVLFMCQQLTRRQPATEVMRFVQYLDRKSELQSRPAEALKQD